MTVWIRGTAVCSFLVALSGCSSLITESSSAGAGIAGAGIASAITNNAAVTTGIGLGVQAAVRAGVEYTERRVHHAEQVRIATTAGPLSVGAVAPWRVVHDIPIENDQHGEVAVSRIIVADETAGLNCKEIVFSVDTVEKKAPVRDFYTADICRGGTADKPDWRWATAEPATSRWGALQ